MSGLPEKIDSKFRFVLLAAQRAERLMQGARQKAEVTDKKTTKAAMQEIRSGLVDWDYGPPPSPGEETAEETPVEA